MAGPTFMSNEPDDREKNIYIEECKYNYQFSASFFPTILQMSLLIFLAQHVKSRFELPILICVVQVLFCYIGYHVDVEQLLL